MRELKIGDVVEYVAENGASRAALVAKVLQKDRRPDGRDEYPSLNLVSVEPVEIEVTVEAPDAPEAPAPEPEPEAPPAPESDETSDPADSPDGLDEPPAEPDPEPEPGPSAAVEKAPPQVLKVRVGVVVEHYDVPWCDVQCFKDVLDADENPTGKKVRVPQALPFWRFLPGT